jgi:hypothetical protein
MAIDTYFGEKIINCKSNDKSTFVNYSEGVGNFSLVECINKNEVPFGMSKRFINFNMTVNESRILKIWDKASRLYKATT